MPGPGRGIALLAPAAGYRWDFGAEVSAGHCRCDGRAGPGGAGLEHVACVLVCMCVHMRVLLCFAMGEYLFVISFIVLIPLKME